MKSSRISVVEHEAAPARAVLGLLRGEGYEAAHFESPQAFLASLERWRPEAVVLEMRLPGMDGKDVLRVLRANRETAALPVLAVAGPDCSSAEVAHGLLAGADEYLLHPLDPQLFLLRLQYLLRRRGAAAVKESYELGALRVAPQERLCRLGRRALRLSPREFDLLVHFLRHRDRVLTKAALRAAVLGGNGAEGSRALDKHVETLRRKLGAYGRRLRTVFGVGYLLK